MKELYSHLLENVFQGFIERKPEILRALDEFDGDLGISDDVLTFTIPTLFEFVCRSYEESSGRRVSSDHNSYLRFRKLLYSNPTNSLLKERGSRVEIGTTNKDHNLSTYRLVRDAGE